MLQAISLQGLQFCIRHSLFGSASDCMPASETLVTSPEIWVAPPDRRLDDT